MRMYYGRPQVSPNALLYPDCCMSAVFKMVTGGLMQYSCFQQRNDVIAAENAQQKTGTGCFGA